MVDTTDTVRHYRVFANMPFPGHCCGDMSRQQARAELRHRQKGLLHTGLLLQIPAQAHYGRHRQLLLVRAFSFIKTALLSNCSLFRVLLSGRQQYYITQVRSYT